MKYIFSAIGGSGSTYLVRSLSARLEVGNKPDTVYRAQLPELSLGKVNSQQGSVADRAPGFPEINEESIEQFLIRYVAYLRAKPGRTAVFNTVAELGLFSRHRIDGVVFLIRHPLHAFASWAKTERHGDVVAYLGGINSPRAIAHFARRWNAVVCEAQRLKSLGLLGGVLRYEFLNTDLGSLQELNWIFANFDSSKRNTGILSPEAEAVLRGITSKSFGLFYDSWEC